VDARQSGAAGVADTSPMSDRPRLAAVSAERQSTATSWSKVMGDGSLGGP
jgi:hypothetical protein